MKFYVEAPLYERFAIGKDEADAAFYKLHLSASHGRPF